MRGAVPLEDFEVERESWDNQPDGFRLRVRFKRLPTPEEVDDDVFTDPYVPVFDSEEYSLGVLVRQHPDTDGEVYLWSRNDVTNDVVQMALEHALHLYCENRFDPDDVCVHDVHVEEYRRIRTVHAGNENDVGVGQPHSEGDLPDWADV